MSPSAGTYFQLLDYSLISEESDLELAQRWTRDIGVASIPLGVFYESGQQAPVLRFCFAKDDDTLRRAAEILCQL